MDLPHRGRRVLAKKKQFRETILFVHHFGGNRASVKRHQDFVADLGFDSVSFDLSFWFDPQKFPIPLLKHSQPLLRDRWQKQIAEMLTAISGPKIVYSFSFSSNLAAVVMAQSFSNDIVAWIADGGPFLMPLRCFWNYFTFIEPTRFLPLKLLKLALGFNSLQFWNLKKELHSALEKLPEELAVLSIRSWQDRLVPIAAIDEAFSGPHAFRFETLTLPEADHINGFEKFPAEYKPRIAKFLSEHAHHLSDSHTFASHH